jgi:hypothetical protein
MFRFFVGKIFLPQFGFILFASVAGTWSVYKSTQTRATRVHLRMDGSQLCLIGLTCMLFEKLELSVARVCGSLHFVVLKLLATT